jgi:hypothetical protein
MLLGGVLADRISPRDLGAWVERPARRPDGDRRVPGARWPDPDLATWSLSASCSGRWTPSSSRHQHARATARAARPPGRSQRPDAGDRPIDGHGRPGHRGFTIALIGVGIAFVVDAASFAVAALALWLVRSGATAGSQAELTAEPALAAAAVTAVPGSQQTTSSPDAPSASIASSLVEGARSVLGDPVMRSIVLVSTAVNLAFTGPVAVGLPWLVLSVSR